jgi:hypothetical protein
MPLGMVVRGAVTLAVLGACSRTVQPEAEVQVAPESRRSVGAGGAVASSFAAPDGAVATHAATPRPGTGVAVVELFTSEGCSSCPPADRVLSELAARAKSAALPVYVLSFHVDYWNYLGWRDRFSSASYSERQRGYAGINPSGGTYTPQAVINGDSECVGSDSSQLDALIARALKREPRTQIELRARRAGGGIEVSYRVSGDSAARVLNLALLEPHAESAVKSGENSGERLAHVNVVRRFESRALAEGNVGSWSFKPGADFDTRQVGIVAYTEDAAQRDISGATELELD